MGQPILTATLALTMAFIFTAAIAIVTLATETLRRAMRLTVVGAVIAVAAIAFQRADLRINLTSSMPVGIYVLLPLPPNGATRGMLVATCAPAPAAQVGRQRGYLGVGPCAGDTELLLKFVTAIGGDGIDVTAAGVLVNGQLLLHSQAASRDRSGRRLVPWPTGAYRLADGEVWLYAPNDWSWDSRYWGPAANGDIVAKVVPLLRFAKETYYGEPEVQRLEAAPTPPPKAYSAAYSGSHHREIRQRVVRIDHSSRRN